MYADCIIVLAKQPAPGLAKTRLAAVVGCGAARELAEAFLDDTLRLVRSVPAATLLLSFTPDGAHEWFAERAGEDALLHAQPEGDLGARLDAAFHAAFAAGARRVVAIATDSPSLPRETLVEGLRALRRRRVVLGPAQDGGYYLIGMSRILPRLFEAIEWSTDRVCRQTLARAHGLCLTPTLLPVWYDVDDARGLQRLRTDLAAAMASCPHTRTVLAALDNQATPARVV